MSEYTTQELVRFTTDCGASGAFVACVATDIDGRHIAREVARKHDRLGGGVTDAPPAGSFATHLWQGATKDAWRRADHQSRALMRAAGVAPAEADA
jgi:hypothetical protein